MGKLTIFNVLLEIWELISQSKKYKIFLLLVLMIISSLAEVVSIGAVIPFLGIITSSDNVLNNTYIINFKKYYDINNLEDIKFLITTLFCLIAIIAGVLRLILVWAQNRLSHLIGAEFSCEMYRRTLYQPYSVHVSRNSSEVINGVFTKANAVVGHAIMPILNIINSVIMVISILITLILIEPVVACLSVLSFTSIYVILALITQLRLKKYSEVISTETSNVLKTLQEGLGGIRDVLLDSSQETYIEIYKKSDRPLRRAYANSQIIGACPRYGIEALGMVLIALIAFSLSGNKNDSYEIIPVLGSLALGAQKLLPIIQQAYASWSHMCSGEDMLKDVILYMKQKMPSFNLDDDNLKFEKTIKFEKINFKYSNSSPKVLNDFSLIINKGDRIGLIGHTGSGKSTILDIVMGLLYPNNGDLSVDDVKINNKNMVYWQKKIAHVPQTVFLADSSIVENIAFGIKQTEIDLNKINTALKSAQLYDFVHSLPKGLDTFVGERGVRLSGGQRQRIGIARALYKEAEVIIFDEATSALDSETEMLVMNSIESLDKTLTIILVAHRVTTLKGCNKIIDIENGNLKRSGSYFEMVNI